MNTKALLVLLLALNLALAGVAFWFWRDRTSPAAASSAASAGTGSHSNAETAVESPEGVDASAGTPEFTYRRLLSADLKSYIANLRRVNCPESTVQDIILAEVHRRYAAREAAMGVHRHHQNPWDPKPAGGGRDWKKWTQLRALREEKQALVKDLLGIDVSLDLPNWNIDPNVTLEKALAALPEALREPARELIERHRERQREIVDRAGGIFLPEDADQYRKANVDRRKEMEALLGPQAFEKFEMETSSIGRSLRSRFEGFEFSESEFSRLFRSQITADELQVPGPIVGQTPERSAEYNTTIAAALQRSQQELIDVRALMSPDRQAQLDRVQDPVFRETLQQVTAAGLPPETAVQSYDMARSLRGEMMSILQNPNADLQQRQRDVLEFYNAAEQRLRDSLGAGTVDQIGGLGRLLGLERHSIDPAIRQLQQRAGILRSP